MEHIEIRIQERLWSRLERMAKEQRRSVADEAALMVEKAVEQAIWMEECQKGMTDRQQAQALPLPGYYP